VAGRYEQQLQQLGPALAPVLQRFDGLSLHDAVVTSISQRGEQFVLVLHSDVPPREIVTLTYTLTGEPFIDREALPGELRSRLMQYQYDEFDLVQEAGAGHHLHAILFSNGWELRLPFREVQVERAEPIYVLPTQDRV